MKSFTVFAIAIVLVFVGALAQANEPANNEDGIASFITLFEREQCEFVVINLDYDEEEGDSPLLCLGPSNVVELVVELDDVHSVSEDAETATPSIPNTIL